MEEMTAFQRFFEVTKDMTMAQAVLLVGMIGSFTIGVFSVLAASFLGPNHTVRIIHTEGKPEKSFAEEWAGVKAFFARKKTPAEVKPEVVK